MELHERRPGKNRFGTPRGDSREINDLALLLQGWLTSEGLSGRTLLARLTPDHFPDRRVPSRDAVYSALNGIGLGWPLIAAIADICSSDTATEQRLLDQARPLWDADQHRPTPVVNIPAASTASDVEAILAAKENIIALQRELLGCQKVLMVSEQARRDAHQVILGLLDTIRHQTTVIQRLSSIATTEGGAHLRPQLIQARDTHAAAHVELARAEQDRAIFGHVAEAAHHTIDQLRVELNRIQGTAHTPAYDTVGSTALKFDDAYLTPLADAVDQARRILDQREEAVRAAVADLGGPGHFAPPRQTRETRSPGAFLLGARGRTTAAFPPRGPSRRQILIGGGAALAAVASTLVTLHLTETNTAAEPEGQLITIYMNDEPGKSVLEENSRPLSDWGAFNGLARFTSGIDAVMQAPDNKTHYWAFSGDEYIRIMVNGDIDVNARLLGPKPLSNWVAFNGLAGFTSRIDAAMQVPGDVNQYWVFSGSEYIHIEVEDETSADTRLSQPEPLGNWGAFSGLARFSSRVDAVMQVPGDVNQYWVFSGSEYIRIAVNVDTATSTRLLGPKPLSDWGAFGGLERFASRIESVMRSAVDPNRYWVFSRG
ncbi:hypothetical protein ACGF8B_37850 [Streptomyces sp. NPDC047917]|uniref:hypothetical protein n=1 Tax=Streptomyces sp. NPDC047917 TaxID=3365491 RepID=UPI003718E4FA